jgi:toxin CcdB
MAQFDVYARVGRTKSYVVDLQADLLDQLTLWVVAPMIISSTAAILSGLPPLIPFQDNEYIVLTDQLAAVSTLELQYHVGSLSADPDAIKQALDILFPGF